MQPACEHLPQFLLCPGLTTPFRFSSHLSPNPAPLLFPPSFAAFYTKINSVTSLCIKAKSPPAQASFELGKYPRMTRTSDSPTSVSGVMGLQARASSLNSSHFHSVSVCHQTTRWGLFEAHKDTPCWFCFCSDFTVTEVPISYRKVNEESPWIEVMKEKNHFSLDLIYLRSRLVLERLLSGVWCPLSTWWLTTACNSNSRGSHAAFWPV